MAIALRCADITCHVLHLGCPCGCVTRAAALLTTASFRVMILEHAYAPNHYSATNSDLPSEIPPELLLAVFFHLHLLRTVRCSGHSIEGWILPARFSTSTCAIPAPIVALGTPNPNVSYCGGLSSTFSVVRSSIRVRLQSTTHGHCYRVGVDSQQECVGV